MIVKKIIGIFLVIFGSLTCVNAQSIKIISATEQSWSGGIPGHYGVNYNVVLKSNKKGIVFDSIYINNIATKLNNADGSIVFDSINHTYHLSAGEAHVDPYPPNNIRDSIAPKLIVPVRHFTGAAMILYSYKGKKHFIIVKKLTTLEGLAYP